MSTAIVRAALETALDGMTPALATAWENELFVPPTAPTPYQSVALVPGDPQNREYGARYLEHGFMQVTLKYPRNAGTGNAEARAKLIRDRFYRGSSWTSGTVTVIVSHTPSIHAGFADGDRWCVPVRIRYFAHIDP